MGSELVLQVHHGKEKFDVQCSTQNRVSELKGVVGAAISIEPQYIRLVHQGKERMKKKIFFSFSVFLSPF